MSITLHLAWRNLWRHPRRTWLTLAAMVFSNVLLVFMISLQFGMYDLMIENTLKIFTGHVQVQAPGYIDDKKMRQTVPNIVPLADSLRRTRAEGVSAPPGRGCESPAESRGTTSRGRRRGGKADPVMI